MFVERLSDLPLVLADASAGPAASLRAAWLGLPNELRSSLVAAGEAALVAPWPHLPVRGFLDYVRDGNRTRHEERYFTRRRLLNDLVMAECVEAEGRYLDAIIDAVFSISEESGWQLPAHNSYIRNSRRHALPDSSRPVIDLFAAETAAQLATVAALLGTALDAVDPLVVARIDRELEARLIRPYLDSHFWWIGNGNEPMNNWTAWCTQNVLRACFSRPTDQATRRAVVAKAASSLDAFAKDYGDDGGCEEGAAYYRHAALCLFGALDVLATTAPTTFASVWAEPKLRNMAEYLARVHVDGPWYVNFGDCAAQLEGCGAREYLFGRAVGSELLMDFAAADWRATGGPDLSREINLAYRVQAAFATADLASHMRPAPAIPDTFYPSLGLLVARDDRFVLAAKGGHNGVGHNHNDVGSVTLYKDGTPLLIDVGVESYTAKTFSPQRYDIWTMQSAFHNLPTFGGIMQSDGGQFAARELQVEQSNGAIGVSMDIAGAYPQTARLRSYRRHVVLEKGKGVRIEDRLDGDLAAELSLMFATRPALSHGHIELAGLAQITLTGAGAMRVEELAIADERLIGSWPDRLYRVLIPITANTLTIEIE